MRRSIIFVVICLFFLLVLPRNESKIPVFLIDTKPTALTKGQTGNALIIAITFEHEQLQPFIQKHSTQPITYLVSSDLLDRSPTLVQTLKKEQYIIGLLGSTTEQYEQSANLLQQQLTTYEKHFKKTPMYFMTQDAYYNEPLLKALVKNQINALAPTKLSSNNVELKKGQHVYIILDEHATPNWQQLEQFVKRHKFSTIEETIFDATLSSSSAP